MRTTLVASIVAATALVGTVAIVTRVAVEHQVKLDAPHMARTRVIDSPSSRTADFWFIKGVVSIGGKTLSTQYIEPNSAGQPVLIVFETKEECDKALKFDSDVVGTLTKFEATVAEAGGTIVVTCEKFEHPPAGRPA